jgi:hypothetical protein
LRNWGFVHRLGIAIEQNSPKSPSTWGGVNSLLAINRHSHSDVGLVCAIGFIMLHGDCNSEPTRSVPLAGRILNAIY